MPRDSLDPIWGSDGVVSLPSASDENDRGVPMDGFVFTPSGLRVDMTSVDREAFLRTGYGPSRGTGEVANDGD